MHPALVEIREAIRATPFAGDVFVVGGSVRDELLGQPLSADFDLVTRGSATELAQLLWDRELSSIAPVTYERFGTAMVRVLDVDIELVTARRESYEAGSRKPTVEAATYAEDAARRDFTVNALMKSIETEELLDPLGTGLADLNDRILRTPLDPRATFRDDPLRMLRAVRFRWRLGFNPVAGLYEAIVAERERLRIVSFERIRDEFVKMLAHPSAPDAMQDLMDLGLFAIVAPELLPMVDCEQGRYHHLDVWRHTLLALRNAGTGDVILSLAVLLHDVGKPPTRQIDAAGNTRFFGHESMGAEMAGGILRRLKFPERDVDAVALLVRNHMRLGSSPTFTASAARRLLRDLDGEPDRLLNLVEADANALRPGVRVVDLAPIRERLAQVQAATPVASLQSPLSGEEIMAHLGLPPGREVGRIKNHLTEMVLEGQLAPDDKPGALREIEKPG